MTSAGSAGAPAQEGARRDDVPRKPVPVTDESTRAYWEAARDRRLVVQTCTRCGASQHPPDVACRTCQWSDLEFRDVPPEGVLYTFAVFVRSFVPGFEAPYVVALVELTGCPGVRMVTNIVQTDIAALEIGMRLEAVFEERDGWSIPQFRARSDST